MGDTPMTPASTIHVPGVEVGGRGEDRPTISAIGRLTVMTV
jgi:hypothetical protein